MRRPLPVLVLVLAFHLPAVAGEDPAPAELPAKYAEWLELVDFLITDEERDYFLSLDRNYRRDSFIDKFWQVRDPESRTHTNELRRSWLERADVAKHTFGSLKDARARLFLLHGEPGRFFLPDGREVGRCYDKSQEIEIWFYGGSDLVLETFVVILFRPPFGRVGPFEVWEPGHRLQGRQRSRLPTTDIRQYCDGEMRGRAFYVIRSDPIYHLTLERLLTPPQPPPEWVSTFASMSAAIPADASRFDVELDFEFPGRNQNRTAVQGVLSVPVDTAATLTVEGETKLHFLLTGEVVRDDALFEVFRYRFELPQDQPQPPLLLFRRYLRPGPVKIVVKLEDLFGKRFALAERDLEVPVAEDRPSLRRLSDVELLAPWVEANEAAARGETTIRIVPLPERTVHVGHVRFDTVTAGEIDRVTFFLNDKSLMTKRRPPFSVDLDLGSTAATHRLQVYAYDASGTEVASDEMVVNQGGHTFRVRLIEPRSNRTYSRSLSAVAQLQIPDGSEVDRVELYLEEERVATLYQPPFVQAIFLETEDLTYVRAVAYLKDGNSTEDVVFVNAPDYLEEVEVQYVELLASVVDRRGQPVLGLVEEDFAVFEDGEPQQVRRFDWVENLPIHAALLIDTSASMEDSIERVAEAALAFVDETIHPKDRLALVSFNQRPTVEVKFTSTRDQVAEALAGLKAEGGTALYDSLVFTLHYFHGVKGQRALLLLSDGKDETSHFDFDGALEVARRAGVTLYVVGLKEAGSDKKSRKVLAKFAEETGGRSFFIQDIGELPEIYATIQEELRTQYFITYQSTSTKDPAEFRAVEVKLVGPGGKGGEVRTMSGYYP